MTVCIKFQKNQSSNKFNHKKLVPVLTSSEAHALKMGVTSSSMFCVRSQSIREDQAEEEERNTIFFLSDIYSSQMMMLEQIWNLISYLSTKRI